MTFKRVVVTGLGALTPIGNTYQEYWQGLKEGKSGAAPITKFDASLFKTKFACEVKNFQVENFMDRKEGRKMDLFAQYAMVSADEAVLSHVLESLERKIVTALKGDLNLQDLLQPRIDPGEITRRSKGLTAFSAQRGDAKLFQDIDEMIELKNLEGALIHN